MGIFSWMSSCGPVDDEPNLVRTNYGNPDLDEIRQAALEDVALIEQDDTLYRGNSQDQPQDQPQDQNQAREQAEEQDDG